MNASEIGPHTFDDLLYVLSDELDHPRIGGYTGFVDSTPELPVDSMYKRLRARNRCNHRDYQNIACNGVRSGSVAQVTSRRLARLA